MSANPAGPRVAPGRFTRAAVALLALDGVALGVGGVLAGRALLVLAGAALAAGAVFVLWYSRWHHRQLAEIAAARAALRDETLALRDLIRER